MLFSLQKLYMHEKKYMSVYSKMQLLFPINKKEIDRIIKMSLDEDIGAGDITSNILIDDHIKAKMNFVAREEFVTAGIFLIRDIFKKLNSDVIVSNEISDGATVSAGMIICTIEGSAKDILLAERTCLNLIQHMSGIATLTSEFVRETKNTNAKILDTRKTTPGLRELEKYAVRVGGGENHRMRLDDRILVKDNHISTIEAQGKDINFIAKKCIDICNSDFINAYPDNIKIEIECDTIEQVKQIINEDIHYILLDNMTLEQLSIAVDLRNASNKNILLEASGGVNINTVKNISKTGVDYISVGALTHSARNVDIGLDQIE